MAFVDNELPESEQDSIKSDLERSPELRAECDRMRALASLLSCPPYPQPRPDIWNNYYRGVCRKMESGAGWGYWAAAALASTAAGSLMIFSLGRNPLAMATGVLCLAGGMALLWMSYYCNCGKR